MKKFMFASMVVVFIALALPATAFAGGVAEGKVVFGGDFTLKSGEVLDGDLAVIGGSVTLEEGSLVEGTVFVLGGSVFAAGEIEKDLAVVGGNVKLGANAVVGGDLVSFGGHVNTGSATVEGDVINETEFVLPTNFNITPDWDWERQFVSIPSFRYSFAGRIVGYLFQSLMLAALAVLVVMFLPKNTRMVAETVVTQPVLAGALGLLTAFVGPLLIFLLLISICFTIVGIFGAVVLVAAWLFGLIAMGLEVGNRLSDATDQDFQPVVAAGLGSLILGLVVFGIGNFIPCIGWIISLLVGFIGTGAVLLTRFGRQEYGVEPATPMPPELPAKKASTPAKKTSSTAKKTSSSAKKSGSKSKKE
jgi:hypothetical protein